MRSGRESVSGATERLSDAIEGAMGGGDKRGDKLVRLSDQRRYQIPTISSKNGSEFAENGSEHRKNGSEFRKFGAEFVRLCTQKSGDLFRSPHRVI